MDTLSIREFLKARPSSSQSPDDLFEDLAAVFVALELVEAGAGRSEQDNVSRLRGGVGFADGVLERLGVNDFGTFDLRFDLGRRRSDRVDALHALFQQVIEHGVVAAFVFPAENEVDVRGKRFQRLDRGIYVGSFGVVVVIDASNRGNKLQPVLDGLKVAHGLADLVWGQPINAPAQTAAKTFSRL